MDEKQTEGSLALTSSYLLLLLGLLLHELPHVILFQHLVRVHRVNVVELLTDLPAIDGDDTLYVHGRQIMYEEREDEQ